MLKKFSIITLILMIIISMCSSVSATELKTNLSVVQQTGETKYLENDQGYISKSIVDSNEDTGEVTIELELSNTAKEITTSTDTEIMIVIDNSNSINQTKTENGDSLKKIVINAAKKLTQDLFANFNNIKVGVIGFSSGMTLSEAATKICDLTSNKDIVTDKLNSFATLSPGSGTIIFLGTNIEAGITLASESFSSNCKNKIIILLTDGIPTDDLCEIYWNHDVISDTKSALSNIGDTHYIISLLAGISDNSQDTVTQLFGTSSNPTTGKFYNVSNSIIEKIVTEDIYADVVEKIQTSMNTVKVVDYFPTDITENFEFSYVEDPSIGTVSENIDEKTRTISWDIGTLKNTEVATLKYKLKLKDINDTEILNKTIPTNEKVVLTYKDIEAKDYTVTLTNSPKIQISGIKEEPEEKPEEKPEEEPKEEPEEKPKNVEDTTVATEKLPQTGTNPTILFIIVPIMVIAIVCYKKYYNYRDIK